MKKFARKRLCEIATIERNVVMPKAISSGTMYIGLEHIATGGEIVGAKPVENAELASAKFHFDRNHILYGKLRPYLAKIALPNFSGVCSTDILPIRPNEQVDRRFICYFLRQPELVKLAASQTSGANLPRLSPSTLEAFEIPLPPLPEQRRIADILDRADALRAQRRAALAQLDALPQAIFLEMFGDPAANPRRWPMSEMRELFASMPIFGSMVPPSSDRGEWLSLRVANIQDWKLDLSDQRFIDLPSNLIQRHSVSDGDLLMARAIATQEHLGKSIVVHPGKHRWAFDSHLMRLRFDQSKVFPEFIHSLLRTPGGRSLFLGVTRRSAVQFNVNTKEIASLKIPVPPIPAQRDFVQLSKSKDQLALQNFKSLSELDSLFASLQHRAFRGEL